MPIDAKKIANKPSRTITRKIDFTTEAVVWRPSDSALPLTRSPLYARNQPDDESHERRLDNPYLEMR